LDCKNFNTELIQEFTSIHKIFVLAKKRFNFTYSNTCYDADLFAWWHTGRMLTLDDTSTSAHDMWNKWWYNENNANDWLPITKHLERCQAMRDVFMSVYQSFEMTTEFVSYEKYMIDNMFGIEANGITVDPALLHQHFEQSTRNGMVYTEYNPYTSTGRPSNKFGGINYAALNKDDGSRSMIRSRFSRGMLLEFDYDAFHVRLIADLINYTLPDESVHMYFGRQYFNKTELTAEEYEQSKQMTFHLLYGGIDKEFEKIPFFGKTKQYIANVWKQFKRDGYIVTPKFKRPIAASSIADANAGKVFNYLLQATETEHNMHVINNVHELLRDYNSRLILYTYDSLLFDFDLDDGKELIFKIKETISASGYPVKIKAGVNYHGMTDMTTKVG
jgi:DNA polymerase I-like protein with 3'-5' exonuclease and polymerase domains